MRSAKLSRLLKILLVIVVVAIGLYLAFVFLDRVLPRGWVAIELKLFSDLFKSTADWVVSFFTSLPNLFQSAVDWAAIPVLKLLSLFRLALPKEIAAGISVCFIFLAVLLLRRARLTKIAFRNIPRRKLRNGLTALTVLLGVSLVVGVNIAFEGVYAQFGHAIIQATGSVDINIKSGPDASLDQSILMKVVETEGVADASPRVNGQVVVLDSDQKVATVIGVNSSSDFDYLSPDTAITRKLPFIKFPIKLRTNSSDVVVDEGLKYAIGDFIPVFVITDLNQTNYSNSTGQIDLSNLYSFTVVGIFHSGQSSFGEQGYRIYIDISRAQEMFKRGNQLDSIIIKVSEVGQTDIVLKELGSTLGESYVITAPKTSILSTIDRTTFGLKSGLQIMSVLGLCVAIIIVLNTVYMNFYERTYEIGILRSTGTSTRQIFWLFFSESLILGVIGSIIGLIVGIMMTDVFRFLALRTFLGSTQTSSPTFDFNLSVAPGQIQYLVLGAIAGISTAVIGGLFPSIAACRINVIQALRPSMRKVGKRSTSLKLIAIGLPLTVIGSFIYMGYAFFEQFQLGLPIVSLLTPIPIAGVILLTAGLLRSGSTFVEHVLFLLGKTRKIVSRNIERNLMRSTVSFALIGISLSFVIVMGGAQQGVVTGVKDVLLSFSNSDLTITSPTSIPRSFSDDLTAIDNGEIISSVTPLLIVPQKTTLANNMTIPRTKSSSTIVAIDPSSYSKVMSMMFTENTPSDALTKLEALGKIILTAPLSRTLNATVGDTISMHIISDNSTNSQNLKDFTVVGIAEAGFMEMQEAFGGFPLSETCYISFENLNYSFPTYNDLANLFFVKAKPNQDIDYIEDRIIELYSSQYKFIVTNYNDILESASSAINEIFVLMYSIVMFAVVISGIGVAALMVMNISERKREIGILRSQGMSKFQVVTSIIGEATFFGILGFIVGTILGLIFHRITVSYMRLMGFPMSYFMPLDNIGIALGLAVLTSVISAVYPAYRASKLNIVEALKR